MICIRAIPLSLASLMAIAVAAPLLAKPPIAELLKLHTQEARAYHIFRDEKHTQELELNTKPVFNWTNVVGEDTQFGHVFVWTNAGRPEAIGTMFSTRYVDPKRR